MTFVNIEGLEKSEVLAALYNAAAVPRGEMAQQAIYGNYVMDSHWAHGHIFTRGPLREINGVLQPHPKNLEFQYLFGRHLRVKLAENHFWARPYDFYNGVTGTAERVIRDLRETGDFRRYSTQPLDLWKKEVIDESLSRFGKDPNVGDTLGAVAYFLVGMARHAGSEHIAHDENTRPTLVEALDNGRAAGEKAMYELAMLALEDPVA
jgi:hypothetical protein